MAETKVTSADGTPLAARYSGSGSPMVMVHGALDDLNAFAFVEDMLAQRHTVWVYSRRGRGGSGDGPDYSLQREIEDVLAVVEAAGDSVHLVGHSSGAYYSLLAASRAPQLRSLTLYEPPLNVERIDPGVFEAIRAAVRGNDLDRAVAMFLPIGDITAPEEVDALRNEKEVWQGLCEGVKVFPREHQAFLDDGQRLLSQSGVPDVPLLYLYGELTSGAAFLSLDEVAELLPGARVHCIVGQRHMAPAFDPENFASPILEFTAAIDDRSLLAHDSV